MHDLNPTGARADRKPEVEKVDEDLETLGDILYTLKDSINIIEVALDNN